MEERISIQTIKNGDYFVRTGCGIDTYYYEMTKEEYDRVSAIEDYKAKLNAEYEETMSDSIRYGYGFYGCDICTIDGKYYFKVNTGSSCD